MDNLLLDKVKEQGVVDIIGDYLHQLMFKDVLLELKNTFRPKRWNNNIQRLSRRSGTVYSANICYGRIHTGDEIKTKSGTFIKTSRCKIIKEYNNRYDMFTYRTINRTITTAVNYKFLN